MEHGTSANCAPRWGEAEQGLGEWGVGVESADFREQGG